MKLCDDLTDKPAIEEEEKDVKGDQSFNPTLDNPFFFEVYGKVYKVKFLKGKGL